MTDTDETAGHVAALRKADVREAGFAGPAAANYLESLAADLAKTKAELVAAQQEATRDRADYDDARKRLYRQAVDADKARDEAVAKLADTERDYADVCRQLEAKAEVVGEMAEELDVERRKRALLAEERDRFRTMHETASSERDAAQAELAEAKRENAQTEADGVRKTLLLGLVTAQRDDARTQVADRDVQLAEAKAEIERLNQYAEQIKTETHPFVIESMTSEARARAELAELHEALEWAARGDLPCATGPAIAAALVRARRESGA